MVVTIGALLFLRRRLLARERDASHDGLTGLLNRGALREQISAQQRDVNRGRMLDNLFRLEIVAGKYDEAVLSVARLPRRAVVPEMQLLPTYL